MAVPDAFLSGKLVDENGLPPLSAWFSVLTEGILKVTHALIRADESSHPAPKTRISEAGIYLRKENLHSIEAVSYSFDFSCRLCVNRGLLPVDTWG